MWLWFILRGTNSSVSGVVHYGNEMPMDLGMTSLSLTIRWNSVDSVYLREDEYPT
jgi:hypothetical protein